MNTAPEHSEALSKDAAALAKDVTSIARVLTEKHAELAGLNQEITDARSALAKELARMGLVLKGHRERVIALEDEYRNTELQNEAGREKARNELQDIQRLITTARQDRENVQGNLSALNDKKLRVQEELLSIQQRYLETTAREVLETIARMQRYNAEMAQREERMSDIEEKNTTMYKLLTKSTKKPKKK